MRIPVPACFFLILSSVSSFGADPANLEAQRLQLQRAQQQNELQLRMQQYQQSVLSPPAGLSDQLRRNELDLSQRWRQQQLHSEQLRQEQALRATPGASDPASLHQFEIMRAEREGQAQLRQFRWEREAGEAGTPVTRPGNPSGAR